MAASPPLLISDLGRPERFHHMLRVLKPTSPMSVGSWVLGASSTAIALANGAQRLRLVPAPGARGGRDRGARPGARRPTPPCSWPTPPIPAWHEARRELPFVFAAGSAMSAGSAIALVGGGAPARRLALVGAAGELAATTVMERRLGRLSASPTARARPAASPAPRRR